MKHGFLPSCPSPSKSGVIDSVAFLAMEALLTLISQARVLMVGAGGIGCELLKNLVLTGFGEIHVVDLAAGHQLALDALSEGSTVFPPNAEIRYKEYNLGKGHGMSVYQMVEAMRKATGFDYKTEVIGRRRGDVPNLTADPTLAEKELGFKAPQSLETMCRDLWNWQSKNPNGYADAAEKEAQQ